jgi:flagella basal body P-ring formation protein FlgA
MLPVVVAATDLPRGALLTEKDLSLEELDITALHRGYMEEITDAIGKKLKRNLQRGQVLTPHQVATPLAVKRGNRVTIIASTPGAFEIRMQGQAMDNGAAGDRIKVKNTSSKRVVEATIRSPGIVEVAL